MAITKADLALIREGILVAQDLNREAARAVSKQRRRILNERIHNANEGVLSLIHELLAAPVRRSKTKTEPERGEEYMPEPKPMLALQG